MNSIRSNAYQCIAMAIVVVLATIDKLLILVSSICGLRLVKPTNSNSELKHTEVERYHYKH